MTQRRADLHTLAGPYALNALPPRDRARFERHLDACDACAQEVRGLQETAARLAGAAAVPPPSRLRERVLAEAARTRQLPPQPDRETGAPRWPWPARRAAPVRRALRSRPWVRPLAMTLSAAFAVAAIAFGAVALVTQHSLSQAQAREHMLAAVLTAPDVKMLSMRVSGGGTATIVMSHRERALALSTVGLPSLPSGKGYELWLMGPAGKRPAAMLPRPAHGMTSPVIATGLRAGDAVELTVEPAGGAAAPSAPILRLSL